MSEIDDFDFGQLLGRGGFAEVRRARNRHTGREVAIKIMQKSILKEKNVFCRVENEIQIHSRLQHEHIVRMLASFQDDTFVYLVMEVCLYGNLFSYLQTNGPLSEISARLIMKQLLHTLHYLHENGIIHRDLKLSNILVSDAAEAPRIKLCDFGLAVRREHPDEEHFKVCGTLQYMAPEIATKQAHSFPVDMWSAGCIFYYVVFGAPPFDQGYGKETLEKIVSGEYAMPAKLSPSARGFLRNLLDLVSDIAS